MGARRTSTGSTVSRWLTTSWSISRTRFVLDGGEACFGIYSGLHQGGSPPMLRSLMPEQLPPPPPPPPPPPTPPPPPPTPRARPTPKTKKPGGRGEERGGGGARPRRRGGGGRRAREHAPQRG